MNKFSAAINLFPFLGRIQLVFKLIFWISLLCLFSLFISIALSLFFENDLVLCNPFISGFLHIDFFHFGYNMLFLFLSLLHSVNTQWKIKDIYWITVIISIIYLPISIFELTPFAVGLSGAGYFFITRAAMGSHHFFKIGLILLTIFEIISIPETKDIAHGVHIIGILLGYFSIRLDSEYQNQYNIIMIIYQRIVRLYSRIRLSPHVYH